MARTITFRIKRFDPDTDKIWVQDYELDVTPGMTVQFPVLVSTEQP